LAWQSQTDQKMGRELVSKADLIKAWAAHVDEAKHVSHNVNGQPLFEISKDGASIECTFPGCQWGKN